MYVSAATSSACVVGCHSGRKSVGGSVTQTLTTPQQYDSSCGCAHCMFHLSDCLRALQFYQTRHPRKCNQLGLPVEAMLPPPAGDNSSGRGNSESASPGTTTTRALDVTCRPKTHLLQRNPHVRLVRFRSRCHCEFGLASQLLTSFRQVRSSKNLCTTQMSLTCLLLCCLLRNNAYQGDQHPRVQDLS